MVDYGKIIKGSLGFSIEPKRWLPFFALDLTTFLIVISYMFLNMPVFRAMDSAPSGYMFTSLMGVFLVMGVVFLVWIFLRMYISGAIIHQAIKSREYSKSWKVSRERYLSLLAVLLITAVISGLIGMVPYVGWIFSIVISLVFLFSFSAVIAGKKKFDQALSSSYRIFRKKKFEVFLTWLLMLILSTLIAFLFAFPLLMILLFAVMPDIVSIGENMAFTEVLYLFVRNFWILLPGVIVATIGASVSKVFEHYATTNFYLQFRKGVKGA